MPPEIAAPLLEWYAHNARSLPWRGVQDPYAVWVSEIMLQQTRVETVIPYYLRWMEHFPSLEALARASQQEVLGLWEGLGYYSRARSLHQAAQRVLQDHGGALPASRAELERLPGVGRYTAGAIASIAFGLDEAALDGNIRRVLARLFDVSLPARSPQGERALWELARQVLPAGRAGDFNQALMDLGSSICTPRQPRCLLCPLAEPCRARALGNQEERPVMESRGPLPHHVVAAAVIQRDGLVLLAQRPAGGLLGGLWEFPGGKREPGEELPACLRREILEELGVEVQVGENLGVFEHAYTHFRVTLHAFLCSLPPEAQPQPLEASALAWVQPQELKSYPMGKLDRLVSKKIH